MGLTWKRRKVVRLTGYAADVYVSDFADPLPTSHNAINVTDESDGAARGGQTNGRIIARSRIAG
jgi:hypothetical protein